MVEALLDAAKALVQIVTPLNLAVVSFIEAIFFPIPPDVLLIPLVLLRPAEGLVFALIAAICSVLGAVCGYALGKRAGRPVLNRVISPQRFAQAEWLMRRYDVWAIAVAGFTPVPYKVFAIASGLFAIELWRLVVVSTQRFADAEWMLRRYDVWDVAVAGFTPVRYKVFAIASGVFAIELWRFVVVSLISRGTRFVLIALLLVYFGPQMADFIQEHF